MAANYQPLKFALQKNVPIRDQIIAVLGGVEFLKRKIISRSGKLTDPKVLKRTSLMTTQLVAIVSLIT